MSQGIYISVPFCRTKCTFCNFASGVFSRAVFDKYVEQVCIDIAASRQIAQELGGGLESGVDSIYLGGGTPSVLAPEQLARLFRAVRDNFDVDPSAEITVECAPGTITGEILQTLVACGVNRVSLGVQSFVDNECSSVGRLHTRAITLADVARLRAGGIGNISIDLIAGLPHQTEESWNFSLAETLATGVPHGSVYMLEVDEDSRLGSELIAGGSRYHAHFVPDDDLTADLYLAACERLERGGVRQYEISNFARPVTHATTPTSAEAVLNGGPGNLVGLWESQHNLKYWTRQPYMGFGVDAHSMLPASPELRSQGVEAVRFATSEVLERQLSAISSQPSVSFQPSAAARIQQLRSSRTLVDAQAALEESLFLGLRLNRGVSLSKLRASFSEAGVDSYSPAIDELVAIGLLETKHDLLRLTSRGRLLSNEVFERFLRSPDRDSILG